MASHGSCSCKYKYVLVEANSFTSVLSPLKCTQRIKYTCFEVSENFIIFGATSGGLYLFKREPCHFLHLLPNKEGPITNVTISPDEKFIAFSTTRGIACVLEHDEDGAKLINKSLEHSGSVITTLCWADTSAQLYVGDNVGHLSVINVSMFMSKNIFQCPAYVFLNLDSGIVQVCCQGDLLLVSTQTRCYICDTTKENYKQIGNKLREGDYGACFLNSSNCLKLFCARPGSRLWEVDISGTVLSTHQFKRALGIEPVLLVSIENNKLYSSSLKSWPEQSLNFAQLSTIMTRYVFTYTNDGIYIFDPEKVDVVLWSGHYKDISCAKCINDAVYIWTSNGELHELIVTSVDKCLLRLYFREYYQLCLEVCERFADYIKSPEELSKLSPLTGLRDHLSHFSGSHRLCKFLQKLVLHVTGKQFTAKLDSGIFLVENRHLKWKLSEENSFVMNCEDSRSQSLPPETSCLKDEPASDTCKNKTLCSNSASSLPDLNNYTDLADKFTSEQSPHSGINNSPSATLKSQTHMTNTDFEDFEFPPISFLSFTSPDVIHNVIIELGQNVSGKLYSSTKSLRDKWQVLEGKFKFMKDNVAYEAFEFSKPVNYNGSFTEYDLKDLEEEIVAGRKKQVKSDRSNIDVSDILKLCEDVKKLENGKKSDVVMSLIDYVIKANKENDKNLVKGSKGHIKKMFPFSHCLDVNSILVIQKIFHDALKSGKIIKCLQRLQKEEVTLVTNHVQHPFLLQAIHKDAVLKLDFILSNLLFLFSEILDPFTILQSLEGTGLPCTFMSWCLVLETFQESTFNYITGNNDDASISYNDWPLPLLLNTMYLMFRLDQVESSCVMAIDGNIKLRHISYLLLKLAIHLESTGVPKSECYDRCNKLYLNFIMKLIEKQAVTENDVNDIDVLTHLECAVIKLCIQNVPICKCGYPLVGQCKTNIKYLPIGRLLMNYYLYYYCQSNFCELNDDDEINTSCHEKNQLKDKCSQNIQCKKGRKKIDKSQTQLLFKYLDPDYFTEKNEKCIETHKISKLIRLLKVLPELILNIMKKLSGDISEFLPFIVQFGKISEIDKLNEKNSTEFWNNVCSLTVRLNNGECCICNHKNGVNTIDVNWNELSMLMLKCLGPLDTLKMLMNYSSHISPGKLEVSFYRACLLSGLIYSGTSEFSPSLIDAYCKSISRPPIGHMSEDHHLLTWEADTSDGHTPAIVHSKDRKNWGITLDLNIDACSRCSLVLNSEKLIQDGGLRAFKCGHAYHVVCLRLCQSLFSCPMCT